MITLFVFVAFSLQSQCMIWCKDDGTKKAKTIAFKLVLEPVNGATPIISSDKNGMIFIGKKSYQKLKFKKILAFKFTDPSMHQYYAAPYILKHKNVILGTLCGKTLVATTNW
jgi:hypothetical protein